LSTLAYLPQAVEELLVKAEVEDIADPARLAGLPPLLQERLPFLLAGGRVDGRTATWVERVEHRAIALVPAVEQGRFQRVHEEGHGMVLLLHSRA
jgi:hypothetical protein